MDFNWVEILRISKQIVIGMSVLALLVFVHELGHFLVAKWRKVTVNSFSIGFGPVLLKKKVGDTEYRISAIPFGGYVSMAGESPGDIKGEAGEFAEKLIWERMAIAVAGPLVNIIFAVFILWIGFAFVGMEEEIVPAENGIVISHIFDPSFAKTTGIEPGDAILSLNGDTLSSWTKLNEKLIFENSEKIPAQIVKNDGSIITIDLKITDTVIDGMAQKYLPIIPLGDITITQILKDGAADKAGLKVDDKIISLNGKKINSTNQFIKIVKKSKGIDTLYLIVNRDSATVNISPMVAKLVDSIPRIGIGLKGQLSVTKTYGIFGAVPAAIDKTVYIVKFTMISFQKLLSGQVKLKHMSGPVGIVKTTGSVAELGLGYLIFFIALISINLGIFNLLPLAVTDGGLIMFYTIEAIRGKPLTVENQMRIQQVALVFFITFALFITFVDIKRLIG